MALPSSNPFFVEEEEDDAFTFRGSSRRRTDGSDPFQLDDEPVDFVQIQQNSMNRQLETTQRCLASIYDSEAKGIATAEVSLVLYFAFNHNHVNYTENIF